MTQHEPLWPCDVKIPVIGVTGPYSSGKTLFGLTISPKETLVFDTEKGAASYEALGFKRIDLADEVQKLHPNGATAEQTYKAWLKLIRQIPSGKYSVIVVDPIDDLENGLIDAVSNDYSSYGFNSRESFDKSGGIRWATIKNQWKSVLSDLSARCQTFVFTTHLRRVWRGGFPTDEVAPRGKTTLMELASLYLLLERQGNGIPSAIPLKKRIMVPVLSDAGLTMRDALPPRMPEGTPQGLRYYIANPVDPANLKDEEKAPDRPIGGSTEASGESALEAARRIAAERATGGPPITDEEAAAMKDAAEVAGIADKVLTGIGTVLEKRGAACGEQEANIVALAKKLTRAEYTKLLEKIQERTPKES